MAQAAQCHSRTAVRSATLRATMARRLCSCSLCASVEQLLICVGNAGGGIYAAAYSTNNTISFAQCLMNGNTAGSCQCLHLLTRMLTSATSVPLRRRVWRWRTVCVGPRWQQCNTDCKLYANWEHQWYVQIMENVVCSVIFGT